MEADKELEKGEWSEIKLSIGDRMLLRALWQKLQVKRVEVPSILTEDSSKKSKLAEKARDSLKSDYSSTDTGTTKRVIVPLVR